MSIPNDYTGYAAWDTRATVLHRYFVNGETQWVGNDAAEGGWEKARPTAWAQAQFAPIDALPEGVPPCPAAPVESKYPKGYAKVASGGGSRLRYFDKDGELWVWQTGRRRWQRMWASAVPLPPDRYTPLDGPPDGVDPHPEDLDRIKAGYYEDKSQLRYYPEGFLNVEGHLFDAHFGRDWHVQYAPTSYLKDPGFTYLGEDPPKGVERSTLDPKYVEASVPKVGYYQRPGGVLRYHDGVSAHRFYGAHQRRWQEQENSDGFFAPGGGTLVFAGGEDPPEPLPRCPVDPKARLGVFGNGPGYYRLESNGYIYRVFDENTPVRFYPLNGPWMCGSLPRTYSPDGTSFLGDAPPSGVPVCTFGPKPTPAPTPKVQGYKAFVYDNDNDPITDFTSVEVSEDRKTLTLRFYEESGDLFELPFEDNGTNAGQVGAWVKALRRAADTLEAWDEEHGE